MNLATRPNSSTTVAGLNVAGASRERENEEAGYFLSAQFALKATGRTVQMPEPVAA
jgi:hypothetical protein